MLRALTGTIRTLCRGRCAGFAVIALVLAAAAPASAANRLALIIGNDTYDEVAPLARAVSDARAYRKLLEESRGFRVFYAENAGRDRMNQRVSEFLSAIQPGDTAMVVYSGHGVQLENERRDSLYLLPTDFPNRDPGRGAESYFFDTEALNFARLAENVARRGAKLRVFVLDACRNNPFNRENATRAIGMTRGIGRIQSSSGEFVIYAAAPGEVAFDSLPGDTAESVNSLFTRAFIKHFREGAYLEDVANDVQAEVVNLARSANVEQEPYYSDGVAGRTCLDDACGNMAATAALTGAEAEREKLYWGYCESKDEPAYCRAYLETYPEGWHAPLARARLAELNAEGGASTGARDGKTEVVERTPDGDVTRDTAESKLPQTGNSDGTASDGTEVASLDPDEIKAGETSDATGAVVAGGEEIIQPTRDELRDVQARLTILGHRPGPVDGLMGQRTRSALSDFQKANGLTADGGITRELMSRLATAVPDARLQSFYAEQRAAAARAARQREAERAAAADRAAAREREAARERDAARAREAATANRDATERAREAERRAAEAERRAAEAERKAAEERRAATAGTMNDARGGNSNVRLRDRGPLPAYCVNLWARDKDECQ